jgi:hypothetical protein
MAIFGAGIPAGATIVSLTGGTGGTSFEMSAAATSTNVATALRFTTGTITLGNILTVGRTFAGAQIDAYATHNHGVNDPGHAHSYAIWAERRTAEGGQSSFWAQTGSSTTGSATTGLTVNNSFTGNTETRPKNYAVLYIIKT